VARTKSILIVGGSGFIGTNLCLKLRDSYKVFATYHAKPAAIPGVTFLPFSVENRNWVKRVVYTTQPDVIIYAAGNNSLRWAEANTRLAELVHGNGPATIASSTDILQPRFIFLSNPYVFDGSRGNYHEQDIVLPVTVLGRAKLSGENVIKNKCLNYIILRSSPVYGRGNGMSLSFLDQLRMSLDRKERIEMPSQELHSFAPIEGLCDLVSRLIDSGVRNRILHYGGLTKLTFVDFCRNFAKRFNYDPALIIASQRMQRKMLNNEEVDFDFSLNSTQSTEILKIKPLLLEEGFDLIEKKLIPRP
jgi:dTDP-4-dehydrorhamnose reductase